MWAVKKRINGEITAMCSTKEDAEALACKDLGHSALYMVEKMSDEPEIREEYDYKQTTAQRLME